MKNTSARPIPDLRRLVRSGQYWTVIVAPWMVRLTQALEMRYNHCQAYQTRIVPEMDPYQWVTVILLPKREVSAADLKTFLAERHAKPWDGYTLNTRDILFPSEPGDPLLPILMASFLTWVDHGRVPPDLN